MKKERNSNIELLRIISIAMIVISHYCIHGIGRLTIDGLKLSINHFILNIFNLGNLGSILFILISGYYLINSNNIKIKKIIRFISQVLFCSILIYLLLNLFHIEEFNIKSFIKCVFPITFKEYWFATAYIILYIFHPFINKLLNALNQKEHFLFISLLFIIFSILHTIFFNDYYGNELTQFLLYYSIGAYLFKYPDNLLNKKNHSFKIMFASLILIILSIISLDILNVYKPLLNVSSIYLLSRTSPLAILFCASLFNIFINKKTYENKFINFIASLMFGVYLISDNKYLRPIIWNNIFQSQKYINSPYLIIHMITATILTIIGCLIIEYFRKQIIEKNLSKLFDNKIDRFQKNVEKKIYAK